MDYRDIKTGGCLMQNDGIAERPYRSFLQYYHTSLSNHLLKKPLCVFQIFPTCKMCRLWYQRDSLQKPSYQGMHYLSHFYISMAWCNTIVSVSNVTHNCQFSLSRCNIHHMWRHQQNSTLLQNSVILDQLFSHFCDFFFINTAQGATKILQEITLWLHLRKRWEWFTVDWEKNIFMISHFALWRYTFKSWNIDSTSELS